MVRLEPFLKGKGYARVEAEESGLKAVELLAGNSYHLVLLELNLRDIELRDFMSAAREHQPDASFIVLAPPNDAEMIVSALVLGADAYVPLPPDEEELFAVLERHGAAAMQRKNANPDAQPGVSEKTKKLEDELAKTKAQLQDLGEQNRLFEAEAARLNKVLDATKKEAAAKKSAPEVPPGHKVIAIATLEELEAKATFVEFLESENDEIKKERDALLERLRTLGLSDDVPSDVADDFDEPTGAVIIDEEILGAGVEQKAHVAGLVLSDADDADDDEEDLLIMDDDSEEVDLAAVEAMAAKAPATATSTLSAPAALVDNDDELSLEDLADDESEEIDLAAIEALVAKSHPAGLPKMPPVAGRLPPPDGATPMPPTGGDDDEVEADGFEDVNTDALLRLAQDLSVSGEGPTASDLEEMLAAIDDD